MQAEYVTIYIECKYIVLHYMFNVVRVLQYMFNIGTICYITCSKWVQSVTVYVKHRYSMLKYMLNIGTVCYSTC